MKIIKIDFWHEDLNLKKPYTISYETIDFVENIFFKIELEDGTWGIGAGSPAEFVTGENIKNSISLLKKTSKELLLNKDINSFESIIDSLNNYLKKAPAAKAAIDIALYDAFTKYKKIPLVDYFGRCQNELITSITIGIQSIDKTVTECLSHVENGFKSLKLKTGININHDIEMISNVRNAVGEDISIRVDANQGYDYEDLINFINRAEKFNIEIIEQPFRTFDNSLMKKLPNKIKEICVADESLHNNEDAKNLSVHPLSFGIFNIKLMKCGGLKEADAIAKTAFSCGADLMWGCMDESIVSINAALHLAMASPMTKYLDLDGSFDLARDRFEGGFSLKDGALVLNDLPGLGVFEISEKDDR